MADKYIGKTNRELIIEIKGKVENIQEDLKECRPICFATRSKVNIMDERQKNLKWLVTGVAGLITLLLNVVIFAIKKFKGG